MPAGVFSIKAHYEALAGQTTLPDSFRPQVDPASVRSKLARLRFVGKHRVDTKIPQRPPPGRDRHAHPRDRPQREAAPPSAWPWAASSTLLRRPIARRNPGRVRFRDLRQRQAMAGMDRLLRRTRRSAARSFACRAPRSCRSAFGRTGPMAHGGEGSRRVDPAIRDRKGGTDAAGDDVAAQEPTAQSPAQCVARAGTASVLSCTANRSTIVALASFSPITSTARPLRRAASAPPCRARRSPRCPRNARRSTSITIRSTASSTSIASANAPPRRRTSGPSQDSPAPARPPTRSS